MNEEQISAYLEGELTPEAARAFEREMDADAALLREVEAWRETLEAARDWAVADAPGVERADALAVPVDANEPPPARVVAVRPRRLVWQAAAAAAIFITGVWVGGATKAFDAPDPSPGQIGDRPRPPFEHLISATPKKPNKFDNGVNSAKPKIEQKTDGAPFVATVSTRYAKDERGRLTIETTHRTGARALWVVDGGFQVAQTSFGRE
jgi:hypothetical protein